MCIVHRMDTESPAVFACAQAGCETCVEALLKRHERLVHSVLRQQWRGDVTCADLLQEGRIGLWHARHVRQKNKVHILSYQVQHRAVRDLGGKAEAGIRLQFPLRVHAGQNDLHADLGAESRVEGIERVRG